MCQKSFVDNWHLDSKRQLIFAEERKLMIRPLLTGCAHERFATHVREATAVAYPSLFGDPTVPVTDAQIAYFWRLLAEDEEFEVAVVTEEAAGPEPSTHLEEDALVASAQGRQETPDATLDWTDRQRRIPTIRTSKTYARKVNTRIVVDIDDDGVTPKTDFSALVSRHGNNVRLRACFPRVYHALVGGRNKVCSIV
jgi:hypothetical protein